MILKIKAFNKFQSPEKSFIKLLEIQLIAKENVLIKLSINNSLSI